MDAADVIVVGTGFAGLAAPIEAARAGHTVLVIDKRREPGGNSWISGGALAAVDADLQGRYGVRDSSRRMFDDMMRAGRFRNDPELVTRVCMESGDVLAWLRRDLGVRFMDRLDQLGGHSVPRCHTVEGIQGRNILAPMLARARDLGVHLRLNAPLHRLRRQADGTVTGVEVMAAAADDPAVNRVLRARRGVVLACGGFGGEYRAGQAQAARAVTALADATGEGIRIAQAAGAGVMDMDCLQMLPCASPDEDGRGVAPVFASYAVFPHGFMVDPASGRRFVNEWTDRKTRADAMVALGAPAVGIVADSGLEGAGARIREHFDGVVIRRFDDLTTLADHYGIPPAALEATLARYNRGVAAGSDREFGKPLPRGAQPLAPPFYALRLSPKAHSTMGGLRIDTGAQVLDSRGCTIPRLYAAGEVTGGVHGISRLACCAITECLVFGRVAGRRVALEPVLEEVANL